MGCIFKLTAVVALATGIHINLANETFAYSSSGLPEAFSGNTELFNRHLGNLAKDPEGLPGDDAREGGAGRFRLINFSVAETTTTGGGFPDADEDTGSR